MEAEDRSLEDENLSASGMEDDEDSEDVAKRRKLDADSVRAMNKQSIESKLIEEAIQEEQEDMERPPKRRNIHTTDTMKLTLGAAMGSSKTIFQTSDVYTQTSECNDVMESDDAEEMQTSNFLALSKKRLLRTKRNRTPNEATSIPQTQGT